ncbi:MAG: hypothetical protein P8M32_07275 [Phycisphaerales bacterium]|nr:hypothetical protein [Phycisphaerales bacterium]
MKSLVLDQERNQWRYSSCEHQKTLKNLAIQPSICLLGLMQ